MTDNKVKNVTRKIFVPHTYSFFQDRVREAGPGLSLEAAAQFLAQSYVEIKYGIGASFYFGPSCSGTKEGLWVRPRSKKRYPEIILVGPNREKIWLDFIDKFSDPDMWGAVYKDVTAQTKIENGDLFEDEESLDEWYRRKFEE